ncbi:MAG: carboxylating nicotinate-nucleotide diphosphorylase [Cyclobacteriaceae bacterium]
MKNAYLTKEYLDNFIRSTLSEDLGNGDHSSLATLPSDHQGKAQILAKDKGVLAGVELALQIFDIVDNTLKITVYKNDGEKVEPGEVVFELIGKAQSILSAERLVLNCMQRMSGIATATHNLVQKIAHTQAKILDTRKTTPGMRPLEKWAVALGNGYNHRFGLFDLIMLKDNHIDFAGGIDKAIAKAKLYVKQKGLQLKIEVETRSIEEVKQAMTCGADIIMLDNMTLEEMKEAVKIVNGTIPLEASGGIQADTIVSVAETGVDYISIGFLTHSVKSLDLSLKAII